MFLMNEAMFIITEDMFIMNEDMFNVYNDYLSTLIIRTWMYVHILFIVIS